MDIFKNVNCDSLSHDLIAGGSQTFYDKIFSEDDDLQFFVQYPHPVQAPLKCPNEIKLNLFQNGIESDTQKKTYRREFHRMKSKICGQQFQNHALLPNFFIDYMESATNGIVDYGFNVSYCQGNLQKFYDQNTVYLIRPNAENNLVICNLEVPEEEIILEWQSSDPLLNLQNINNGYSNQFIMRGRNTICLTEIENDLQVRVNLKLNSNVGYLSTALNYVNKSELAIMDNRNKLKLFDLNNKSVLSTYTMEDLNINSSRLTKLDYLTENMLMILTDKQIKVLDTRCKVLPQDIDVKLENCDILLNFTADKTKQYITDNVYMSSKHCYFIYNIKMTTVEDFIHHNLISPPCFIDYFDSGKIKLLTLFSQSPKQAAVFATSPYSLPHQLINLEDTYDKCQSQKNLPVIPNIEKRLNYPITGVQLIPNNNDVSIYYTNLFGELFQQDILLKTPYSDTPIEKMYNWLLEIYEKNDPALNIVHFANASAAFDVETDFNEVDLYNYYEKCNVNIFLDDKNFNDENCKADTFLEIWEDTEVNDMSVLLQSESSHNKVEEWIENTKFEIDE
ncbi:hypothetical protein WA026_008792 [Henosepilachna vigintioctopunctata]|uniref:Uncharacterized protein n=1 Tax=Henosepilachna vigintioctopunctata TaxID=420089 RepID=A0AAW1VCF8_9CUCU